MVEGFTDSRLNLRPFTDRNIIGEDVGGECLQAACDGPDMQVVHAADAFHMQNIKQHRIHVNIGRGSFH